MLRKVGLLVGIVLTLSLLYTAVLYSSWQREIVELETQIVTTTVPPRPTVVATAAPATAQALAAAAIPARDSLALAERLRPSDIPIPSIVNPAPPEHVLGEQARFFVSNSDTREVFPITASLQAISDHVEMWVEEGVKVDLKALERAARDFDERIYPTIHQYFGKEWTPGVDNNPQITVLNARFSGAAGYYSSHDQFSRRVNPYSNEREMFYMNVDAAAPGTERYAAILAHEFQHMVHWNLDSNEDSWVNEGASELAARLCGYGATPAVHAFALKPDTQLNHWALSPDEDTLPHYGASYLWMEYFLQRQGPDALKRVLERPENGIAGFEAVLRQIPGTPSFDDLFADWVVANLLDDESRDQDRYGHREVNIRVLAEATHRDFPVQEPATVSQYGTDCIVLAPRSAKAVKIEFRGSPKTSVVPSRPAQGRYQWWSNRGDMSNTRLTREIDLSAVEKATLEYSLWYELEDGWDYGYVGVSTDGGDTWTLLSTEHTTDYDPNGNAFGVGYTGFSGHPPGSTSRLEARWIREKIDLTPYAGQRILIRFEMITDDAVNLPGMCIDDIAVPEVGFADNAEVEVPGWHAEGFARIDNDLAQQFLVQVILEGRTTRVRRLQLDEQQRGTLVVDGFGRDVERVVLAISGLTRYTTEPAHYSYTLTAIR